MVQRLVEELVLIEYMTLDRAGSASPRPVKPGWNSSKKT